jgi:hypothetical protein
LNEAGGDREGHTEELDAELGERGGGMVDERGGVSDAAAAARDAWRGEAEASAQFEEAAATQVGPLGVDCSDVDAARAWSYSLTILCSQPLESSVFF